MVGLVVKLSGTTGTSSAKGKPQAGDCRTVAADKGFPETYDGTRVKCTFAHEMETIYVGVYSSGWTEAEGDGQVNEICEDRAAEFLGGPRHVARIGLTYYVEEAGGSAKRWFSCELAEINTAKQAKLVPRMSTLRGAGANPGQLAITCADHADKDILYLSDCARGHDLEFAGLYTAGKDLDHGTDDELRKAVSAGCEKTVSDYLGWDTRKFEAAEVLDFTYWGATTTTTLAHSTHAYRCFVATVDNKKLTASVKGLGDKPVPLAG
ncbi:septum formation family protein [Longispora sp. K20-0274]|uniref:septum formation family protein n=1 Tax=Longispora sp. K20-0274 TaxID=3088255 RepID=UPI00399BEDFD